jgi:hypothetical protein
MSVCRSISRFHDLNHGGAILSDSNNPTNQPQTPVPDPSPRVADALKAQVGSEVASAKGKLHAAFDQSHSSDSNGTSSHSATPRMMQKIQAADPALQETGVETSRNFAHNHNSGQPE